MYLEIVSPEASLVAGEIESITLPNLKGSIEEAIEAGEKMLTEA